MSASDPESTSKPKAPRKRKTKAEKQAELAAQMAAQASGPLLPPEIWMALGAALLIVAACVFFDPIGFAEAGQPSDDTILRTVIVFLVGTVGKNPVSIVCGVGGAFALIWGFIGWLKKRSTANDPSVSPPVE
jgi:hypothetical protein